MILKATFAMNFPPGKDTGNIVLFDFAAETVAVNYIRLNVDSKHQLERYVCFLL